MRNGKIRIGIMGLGQIGRHLYHLAREIDDIEIVAVADIGKPEIIQYLLNSDGVDEAPCELQDNYLINEKFRTRMLQLARPDEVPWDVLNVHCVVDATGRYRSRRDMEAHLRAGAPRVILASLPAESIDRIVVPGINEGSAAAAENMIPNSNESARWVELVLPKFEGKLSGYALNVPVQRGSLLDVNCVMQA